MGLYFAPFPELVSQTLHGFSLLFNQGFFGALIAKSRVSHLVADLGWVGLDLGCFTILPPCSAE